MESSNFFTAFVIFLVAGAMIFIEKRPLRKVAVIVALMIMTWVVYLVLFQDTPPAP